MLRPSLVVQELKNAIFRFSAWQPHEVPFHPKRKSVIRFAFINLKVIFFVQSVITSKASVLGVAQRVRYL